MLAGTLRLQHRIEHRGSRDRLRKEDVDAERGAARLFFLTCVRTDQDDRQRASFLSRADALGRFEPVHAGQHPVEKNQTERIGPALPVVPLEQRQALFGRGHRHRGDRPTAEQRLDEMATGLRVFDDEHRSFGETCGGDASRPLGLRLDAQARGEVEGSALPPGTVDRQVAAHEPRQAPADDKTEASAAVLPGRGTVGLSERLEEPGLLLGRNADAGVRHTDTQ